MFAFTRKSNLTSSNSMRKRSTCPLLENLEDRVLLYSAYGGTFVYGSRITFSFMPDGTSVGGTPSALYQTLNAKFSQATWQLQFQKAAAVWQAVANINLSQVSDNGSPEATNGNQQDDPRFGDIRIGMINLGSGVLAETLLPPPFNGGTDAGDMFLNSAASWQINTTFDLETVAIHEFGHALGLGESQISTACMYAYYNGLKQTLTTDDVAGIQSVWGAPQPDQFNSNGLSNGSYASPANITSYIGSNGQIAIPSLRITSGTQTEWFSVTVPASTTGTMVVTEQSTNLSMLSPSFVLYRYVSGLPLPVGSVSSASYGATVSYSVAGLQAGQTYLIRAGGNAAGDLTGGFGLEVNFGSVTQPPIAPPNTVVAQQPDQGSGTGAMLQYPTSPVAITIGNLCERGFVEATDAIAFNNNFVAAVQSSLANSSGIAAILGVTPLYAGTPAQTDGWIATLSSVLTTVGQANPLSSGTFLSTLQAIDEALLGWNDSSN